MAGDRSVHLGWGAARELRAGHLAANQYGWASKGVAVDASNGKDGVRERFRANNVSVFDAVTLPGVSLGALSEQTPRSVTLNGTVSPEGFAGDLVRV